MNRNGSLAAHPASGGAATLVVAFLLFLVPQSSAAMDALPTATAGGPAAAAKWSGPAETARAADATLEIVSADGDVGLWTSLELDAQQRPRLSYYDQTLDQLMYAEKSGDVWATQVVDPEGGRWTSLALDAQGNPHIAYHSAAGLDYAWKGGGAWTTEHADGYSQDFGWHPSLAVDPAGNAHVSSVRSPPGLIHASVRYAVRSGSAWTVPYETPELYTSGDLTSTSLALRPNGTAAWAYQRPFNVLIPAFYDGLFVVAQGEPEARAGPWSPLQYWTCSLDFDAGGDAGVSYVSDAETGIPSLWLTRESGGVWSQQRLDPGPECGYYSSLELDPAGYPHISYYDLANGDLKYISLAPTPPRYALTVTVAGNGTVERSPDQALYDSGAVVTLTATPAPASHFVDWTGDVSGGENPIEVTLDGDKSVMATFALDFTEVVTGMAGVEYSSASWGDYDGDGDLDLVLAGWTGAEATTHLYRNDGGGPFSDVATVFPGVSQGSSLAWGDYDGDGDLDLLLAGRLTGTATVAGVYRNDGNGSFSDIGAGLPGVRYTAAAWGDFDDDGDLDFVLTGLTDAAGRITRLYRNQGGGTFEALSPGLPDVRSGTVAWGDYDNDGDLDLLLAGQTVAGVVAGVYRNQGGGVFADIVAGLPGIGWGAVAWGDYDNDGDLDILLAGFTDVIDVGLARVYRNEGNQTFSDIGAGLPQVGNAAAAWGDYDNDGDLDIGLAGWDGAAGASLTGVFRNDGGGTFTDAGAGLPGTSRGAARWGDCDGDGDLDLLLTGSSMGPAPLTHLFRNDGLRANTRPGEPVYPNAAMLGTEVHLAWGQAWDAETPAVGLSYNLRIGTTPGGSEVLAPLSAPDGCRRVAQLGNARFSSTSALQRVLWLPIGRYYWSVQAVDGAYAGSPFAPEGTFESQTAVEYAAPGSLSLDLAGANPADGPVSFRLGLPAGGHVHLEVLDVSGRRLARLVDGDLEAGFHTVTWRVPGPAHGAGVYFARVEAGARTIVRRLIVLE